MGFVKKLAKKIDHAGTQKYVVCSKCGQKKPTMGMNDFEPGNHNQMGICSSGHLVCIDCGKKGFVSRIIGELIYIINPFAFVGEVKQEIGVKLNRSFKKECILCGSKMRPIKENDLDGVV